MLVELVTDNLSDVSYIFSDNGSDTAIRRQNKNYASIISLLERDSSKFCMFLKLCVIKLIIFLS